MSASLLGSGSPAICAAAAGRPPHAEATLVVELLTEELPPKALKQLGRAFADTLAAGLRARGYLADGAITTGYATPRRLAVAITASVPSRPMPRTSTS